MEKIKILQVIQEYISQHYQEEDFNIEKLCRIVGYSRRHIDRIFKEYLNITLSVYIKAIYLTQSAKELCEERKNIIEIALNNHFDSHEGFSRSFTRRFHISPSEYRKNRVAIPLFIQYPISHYYALLKHMEELKMNDGIANVCMVTVTAKERRKRKLIYQKSRKAQDYFSYCEEMGCEWEGLLNSISEKYEQAALVELPDSLVEEGFSKIAAGIEVPLDYNKSIPKTYQIAELPECTMLYFQTEPYENEEDFCTAIESAYVAIGKYNPELHGYKFAYDIAPSFNLGASARSGAILAVPAVHI